MNIRNASRARENLRIGNGVEKIENPLGAPGFNGAPENMYPMSGGAFPMGGATQEVDLRQTLSMLRRRRKIIGATILLVSVLGTILTLMTKPLYQATATLLVNTSASSSSSTSDLPVLSDLMSATKARSQETQIEVVKSSPIQKGALKRVPTLQQKSIAEYAAVDVAPVRNTDVIAVTVTSRDPKAAQTYSQSICDEYIESVQGQNQQQVLTATKYINSQLPGVRAELYAARQKLRRFKEANGTIDITAETQGRVSQLSQAETDLHQAQTEQQQNYAQLQQARAMASKMAPTQMRVSTVVQNPVVESLKQQLTQLEQKRAEAAQEYQPASEQVRTFQGQIDDLKRRLSQQAATQVGTITNDPNPVRAQVLQDAARAQGLVWSNEARVRALEQTTAQARAQIQKLPGKEAQLGQLTTDVATLAQTYQMLNEKYQNLRVSEEAKVSSASVVSPSDLPLRPISPNKPRNIMMSFFLGCMLAFAVASLVERLDDRIHSENEAELASGLSVLAIIPFIAEKEKQSLAGNLSGSSMLLESYRMLRTSIEFASIDQPVRSLVITSSQPNEGKSTTSTDLAIVMALDGKKVILVDADLRRPSLHKMMNLSNKLGFTNVVAGTASLADALQETSVPNLSILASGPIPPNPPELLNSQSAHALFNEMMEIADFVVIDTPPALVLADAQIAASCADAVLLVISIEEAGRNEIACTSQLLAQSGTRVLGSVLNKMTPDAAGYYGYNSKSKYYGSYLDENADVK